MTVVWHDYHTKYAGPAHTAVGIIKRCEAVYSPQLDNQRELLVYLPPSYEYDEAARYPVLYMHDGYNLFDAATSYIGEWQVDETLQMLSVEGIEAIVVGIPNRDDQEPDSRRREYSPYPNAAYGVETGQGAAYMAFLAETVKPLIDASFRTLPDREHTGLAGSSLGGLISLYGFLQYPAVFGLAGVFSPAFWFTAGAIFDYVAAAAFQPGRIYMDVGTAEGANLSDDKTAALAQSMRYVTDARRMRDLLVQKGCHPGHNFVYVEDEGGIHNESAWARRLPGALRFLLG